MIKKIHHSCARTKSLALALALATSVAPAAAGDWYLAPEVRIPNAENALICHFWNATIFAPGEKGSCLVGTILAVDLLARQISYVNAGLQGMGRTVAERELEKDTLGHALQGEGLQRLEQLRSELVQARELARDKADAEQWRERYLSDFKAATTLSRILDFERRYAGKDPDGLISGLTATKVDLQHSEYLEEYNRAQSQAQLASFIDKYQNSDPDNLVSEAKKRQQLQKKKEILAQQQVEKRRADDGNTNTGPIPWVLDVQGFPPGTCTVNDLVNSFEEAKRWGKQRENDRMIQVRSVTEGPNKIVYTYFDRMIDFNSTRTFYRTIEACKAERHGE